MRAWYSNVMPLWRRKKGTWPLGRANVKGPDDDWQQVLRGGPNGIQTIVMALYWWFLKADDEHTLLEASCVCEDLLYVLSDMHKDTMAPEISQVYVSLRASY